MLKREVLSHKQLADILRTETFQAMHKDTRTCWGFFGRLSRMKQDEANGNCDLMSVKKRHNLYTTMADESFDEEEGTSAHQ